MLISYLIMASKPLNLFHYVNFLAHPDTRYFNFPHFQRQFTWATTLASQGEPLQTPAGSERFIYADEAEYFELDTGIWQAIAARIPMEVERLHAEQGFAVEFL